MFHLELPSAGDPWTTPPGSCVACGRMHSHIHTHYAHLVLDPSIRLEQHFYVSDLTLCLLSPASWQLQRRSTADQHYLRTRAGQCVYSTRCHMLQLSQGLSPLTQCSLSTVYKHSDTGCSVYQTKRQRPIGSETACPLKEAIVLNLRGCVGVCVLLNISGMIVVFFDSLFFPTLYSGQIASTLQINVVYVHCDAHRKLLAQTGSCSIVLSYPSLLSHKCVPLPSECFPQSRKTCLCMTVHTSSVSNCK